MYNDRTQAKTKPKPKRKRQERPITCALQYRTTKQNPDALRAVIALYRRNLDAGDAHHAKPKTNALPTKTGVCFVCRAPTTPTADEARERGKQKPRTTPARRPPGTARKFGRLKHQTQTKTEPKPKTKPKPQARAHAQHRAPGENRARLFSSGRFLFLLTRATLPLQRPVPGVFVPAPRTFAKKPVSPFIPRRSCSRGFVPRILFFLLADSFNDCAYLITQSLSPAGAKLPARTGFVIKCPAMCARV